MLPFATLEKYLTLEENSERRSEYLNGQMFPIEDATPRHSEIIINLIGALLPIRKARKCKIVEGSLRIAVKVTGLYTYPDVAVICGPMQFADAAQSAITNPNLVIEVESPTSQDRDMGKIKHYRALPSLEEYLVVAQDQPVVNQFLRQPQGTWMLEEVNGLDQILHLRSLDLEIPLAVVYEGVF